MRVTAGKFAGQPIYLPNGTQIAITAQNWGSPDIERKPKSVTVDRKGPSDTSAH